MECKQLQTKLTKDTIACSFLFFTSFTNKLQKMGNNCMNSKSNNNNKDIGVNNNDVDEKEFKSKLEKLDFQPHLILMGDSILDNIAWVEDPDKGLDVEKLLNIELKKYNDSWKCKNLAVDGNTTKTLIYSLNFYHQNKDQQNQPKRFQSLQYYLEPDANNIDLTKEKPIIILSIGGNDVLGYVHSTNYIKYTLYKNDFV